MKKIIGFDIDGVLTNSTEGHLWEEELVKYYNLETIIDEESYRLEIKYGLTQEQMLEFFRNRSPFVLPKLTMRPGANTLLQELEGEGFTIILITARTKNEETPKWLAANQIPYHRLIHEHEKLDPCVENQVEIFVEDTFSNAVDVSKAIPVLLMTTDYNKSDELPDGVYRVNNFDEIREFILDFYQKESA